MVMFGEAQLGASTFCACAQPHDKCGSDGLPVTPNSIRILGQFQFLKTISHPRLCQYLDIVRSRHERLTVVAEHWSNNVAKESKKGLYTQNHDVLMKLAYQLFEGLAVLHDLGITHRCLAPDNILLDSQGDVKLSQFGFYYMTSSGSDVLFPIGYPSYLSPEALACKLPSNRHHSASECECDTWSVGVLLLQLYTGVQLWKDFSLQQTLSKIISLINSDRDVLEVILQEHNCLDCLDGMDDDFKSLLQQCLRVNPDNRPSACVIMNQQIFNNYRTSHCPAIGDSTNKFTAKLRCRHLQMDKYQMSRQEISTLDHLCERPIREVYYLWCLAGGDLEGELKRNGLIKAIPPICTIPNVMLNSGEIFGQERERLNQFDTTVIVLPMTNLKQRLSAVDPASYYPLLESDAAVLLSQSISSQDLSETARLPLVIRQNDIEYQFHRVILYERLVMGYPYTRDKIWKESRTDIPPLYRGEVWAMILGVQGDPQAQFDIIDKETAIPTDRQIEVDIPRCHQYDELLSSPTGHLKLKRVLKAWVVSNPDLVYWQGLDSLCAPFLSLNFSDEALAYSCLSLFIPKYLNRFFLRDNSPVIREYLTVFSHMISFHEVELSNHLNTIGFIPELYAIPWFLTMFTHVFPLQKIYHLWDTLLLGSSSFPIFIGVAILKQLKDRLLTYGFNECILLFSDMPDIDIGRCLDESVVMFCQTPKSATNRKHSAPPTVSGQNRGMKRSKESPHDLGLKHDMNVMNDLDVDDLKAELACRISAADLAELLEICGFIPAKSPEAIIRINENRNTRSKPKLLVVDVRSHDEYIRGFIPGSINIELETGFNSVGELDPSPAVSQLTAHRGKLTAVIGNSAKHAAKFADELVRLSFGKVCSVHQGISSFTHTGILSV